MKILRRSNKFKITFRAIKKHRDGFRETDFWNQLMPKYGLGFYKDRIKYRGITPLNNLGHSGISLVTENQKKYHVSSVFKHKFSRRITDFSIHEKLEKN